MIGLMAAFALWSAAGVAQGETIGACAWSRLPESDQQAVLTAYDDDMGPAMNALFARDAALQIAARECTARDDLPLLWIQGSIASHVIQLGAAEAVRDASGLERSRLDQAWETAPQEARNCALNNASRVFRVEGPPCRDRGASLAFLANLGLSLTAPSSRTASEQALLYMNAKAQAEIASRLIQNAPRAGG